ncbi:MAG: hypothetical protein ACK4S4_10895 [Pyrinomonadaceae bacterium]
MLNSGNYTAPEDLKRWRSLALGIGGIVSLVVLGVAVIMPDLREQALRSWLLGFMFWAGLGLGSLGILMLQYLTGGAWGVVIRRILEAATRTLPIIVILFIPLAVGVATHSVYEWTHLPKTEHIMAWRGWYMTDWGWLLRTAVYFVLFGVMVWYLNGLSRKQDAAATAEESAGHLESASRFSGPAIIFYVLTLTFATVDWTMTLDPHWFSTIWGLLWVASWGLSTFSFVVLLLSYLQGRSPMDRVIGKRHFHDIGKLMLAFVMVWAYFNFSQFLIIWSGNIPEETGWYITRMRSAWAWVGGGLIFLHFAFPFLVLLNQDFKRKGKKLAMIAVFILLMRFLDLIFIIAPTPRINPMGMEQGAFYLSFLDLLAPIGIGGIWLWWFFGELAKRPLVPANDPFFPNAVEHGRGH